MEKGKGGEREREKKMKKGTERIKKGEKNVERARLSTTWVDFRWMTLVTMVIWRRPWRKCEHEGCVIGDSPSETSWQQAQVHGRLSSILPRSYLFIFFSFFFKNFFFPELYFVRRRRAAKTHRRKPVAPAAVGTHLHLDPPWAPFIGFSRPASFPHFLHSFAGNLARLDGLAPTHGLGWNAKISAKKNKQTNKNDRKNRRPISRALESDADEGKEGRPVIRRGDEPLQMAPPSGEQVRFNPKRRPDVGPSIVFPLPESSTKKKNTDDIKIQKRRRTRNRKRGNKLLSDA